MNFTFILLIFTRPDPPKRPDSISTEMPPIVDQPLDLSPQLVYHLTLFNYCLSLLYRINFSLFSKE